MDEWRWIGIEELATLVESIPDRIQAVIDAKGATTTIITAGTAGITRATASGAATVPRAAIPITTE
ncbi:hypothetical protein DFQ29_000676 [Apophysomyces sp. BC1021]|nr:hypothetical protein DFQ29_000676 [Apophysomyces sp. BC1021]